MFEVSVFVFRVSFFNFGASGFDTSEPRDRDDSLGFSGRAVLGFGVECWG